MIAVEGVHKSFGTNHVLKGIGLQVPEGGVTALIGPSGSGKSTLLRCVNLLEVPEAGRIRIGDSDLHFSTTTKVSARAMLGLRRKTGMVFQSFQLFPHRTAVENVMEGLVTVQGWTSDRARDRAVELLDKVGMSAKADAWPSTLSGGQQQRVAIARALAQSPDVLLCDEPTSALDPQLASEVVDVLLQLARDGTTMVMATHDLRLAAAIATNVVFLDSGEIAEAAPSEQFFSDPQDPRTRRFIYR
ncbi:amino acid ABC transporter ATP-binding protein [Devosia sp.]|uniref:amino acid ABC transporter ATP-binding protein n=1 Tax=Devosia sp. TaxID=1871048 RepID=UPI0019E82922|nr:amino acid ABC transporter ATP-binding protein [Devosia sp.]MBE0579958.1 amino acid ABC transporter ATP-binding protein [Devosia sp.]